MKSTRAFRSAWAVAALVISVFSTPVFAQYGATAFVSGTSALAFELFTFNAMGLEIAPVSATYSSDGVLTSQVSNVGLNGNYEPTQFFLAGGYQLNAPLGSADTLNGGQVTIANLNVVIDDPTHINVFADVSGDNGLTSQSHLLMWTSTGLTADSQTSVTGPDFHSTLKDLYLTQAGKRALFQGLAANSYGQSMIDMQTLYSVGTLGVSLKFSAVPVPESSTYVLTAIGLGAAGWVARRRAKPSA